MRVHRDRIRARLGALVAVLCLVVGLGAVGAGSGTAQAADLTQFRPGNIISNEVFYNSSSMTEAQIGAFINAKGPACTGRVCLKTWTGPSESKPANAMCSAFQGSPAENAASLIFKVSQACGINPQVILVTLQKEQALVTASAPSDYNFNFAMGYNCPDTTGCTANGMGFATQIYGGAWQLKRYANPPGTSQFFTWYAPGRTWNVLWHPDSARCGSAPVYIENQATANLYYYTPYQPNAAALRAGYGTGDGCSSYGNRNFFSYFTDWFGSTQGICPTPSSSSITAADGLFVVTAAGTSVRTGPSLSCAAGARPIAQGVLVPRSATFGEWTRVTMDGVAGWVHRDDLTPVEQTPAATFVLDEPRHVLALDAAGDVWAYPHSPSGRWGAPVRVLAGQSLVQLIEAGDLTSDARRDLIGVDGARQAWLYRGTGTGYAPGVRLNVDWSATTRIAAAGDFTSDFIPDVFTVDAAGYLQLWPGDGRGGFRAPVRIGQGWSAMNALVGGLDLNGDYRTDLLARTADGAMYLYTGDGRGSWLGGGQIGSGWAGMTSIFSAGDFNGDGRRDLFARDAAGGLHLYNAIPGGVAYVAQVGTGWAGMRSLAGPGIAMPPVSVRNIQPGVGDLTGDDAPDVAAVAGSSLLLYHGNGRGGWSGTSTLDAAWPAGARLVTLGDFARDGHRDLGRITADGTFWLLPGAEGGALGAPIVIGHGWGAMTAVIGGVDFDGDGLADVLARSGDGTLLLYRGNGAGGWLADGQAIGNGWADFSALLNVGDFTGDGNADILARSGSTGALWLYPTTGRGGWGEPRAIGQGWWAFTALAGPGDFDGDGRADVLGRTATGALLLYRGDGRGGWLDSRQIGQGWNGIAELG